LVPSLHQRLFYNGDENLRQFDRAWDLTPERRAGRSIPRSCLEPRFLDYWEAGFLGKHLERFFSAVDREHCLVTVFDDFRADPGREYRRVLQILDLEGAGPTGRDPHGGREDSRIASSHPLLK